MLHPSWHFTHTLHIIGFPGGSELKASACNEGDLGSIPGQEDPLEKEMATHSRILAGEVSRGEEAGGLLYMGSQKSWI